jgi:uncharacterized Tic20 family protein
MSSKRFMVRSQSGAVSGPHSSGDLVRLAASGALTPTCAIQQEGGSTWHPASQVKGLKFGGGHAAEPASGASAPAVPPGSSPESQRWWLARPGEQPIGPYAWSDLLRTVKQSGGAGDWMVCAENSTEWRRLDSDPSLVSALQRPAAPARVPDGFPAPAGASPSTGNGMLVAMHLSVLSGVIIPLAGLIVPLALWLTNRSNPRYDAQGKEIMNWVIFLIIYSIVSGILMLVLVGVILVIAGAIGMVVFAILGAIKASKGEFYRYPLPFRLLK